MIAWSLSLTKGVVAVGRTRKHPLARAEMTGADLGRIEWVDFSIVVERSASGFTLKACDGSPPRASGSGQHPIGREERTWPTLAALDAAARSRHGLASFACEWLLGGSIGEALARRLREIDDQVGKYIRIRIIVDGKPVREWFVSRPLGTNRDECLATLVALGGLGGAAAHNHILDCLAELLAHDDYFVRRWAVEAVESLGDAADRDDIVDALAWLQAYEGFTSRPDGVY